MDLCRREGANADIASNVRLGTNLPFGKGSGLSEWCDRPCDFESVERERGWTVGGFNGHVPVADFDAHIRLGCFVLARMIQKTGWIPFLSLPSMLTSWDILLL